MQQITSHHLGSSQMKSTAGGKRESSQQELPTTAPQQAQSPERTWHRQAGHASPQLVCNLLVGLEWSTEQLWLQKHT